MDTDGNGVLTKEELGANIVTKFRTDAMVEADTNNDGVISESEFESSDIVEYLQESFAKVDLDGNKEISVKEIEAVVIKHLEKMEELDTMIASADRNGDGVISRDEFPGQHYQHTSEEL